MSSTSLPASSSQWRVDELVRPNIRSLRPYRSARAQVDTGILLDANENPFEKRLGDVVINRYPDPNQRQLRRLLSDRLQVTPDSVLAGCGSDEILDWIFKLFCRPGLDAVAAAEPTYGMYRVMAEIFDIQFCPVPLEPAFQFSSRTFLETVGPNVRVLFLCSPNNPTGNLLDRREMLRVLEEWRGVVVLDEAYVEFASAESMVGEAARRKNLIVMRTLSKAWGMAGLRIGYVVANPRIIEYCARVKAPYNLSAVAQSEVARLAGEGSDCRRQVERIVRERERIAAELAALPGVEEVFPSQANFILFRCADSSRICRCLLEHGVVVRNRSRLPGLEGCIRVSVGTQSENDRFLELLRKESL